MFLVIGKGQFTRNNLLQKLQQWGFANPDAVITAAEGQRVYADGNITIARIY